MTHTTYNTLTSLLQAASLLPGKGVTFIQTGGEEDRLSYHDLFLEARKTLGYFRQRGVMAGNEVIIRTDDNRCFVTCFWACILGGMIPVPIATGNTDDHKKKLLNIWPVLHRPFLITPAAAFRKYTQDTDADLMQTMDSHLIDTDVTWNLDIPAAIHEADENDIAFIQFSSGSTGSPKGVTLTHRNLICNVSAISTAAGYTPQDSAISWMPLTHDMGLIGFHINPLFMGMDQYLIPTPLFIRRPSLWLEKASQHAVTILCSPNFGYRYTLKHFNPLVPLDLSAVRIIYNGAEPVSRALCDEFQLQLAPHGLNAVALCPVYGLAEASLAVSISDPLAPVSAVLISRKFLQVGDHTQDAAHADDMTECVNVGTCINYCQVRITDDADEILGEDRIGHILLKGGNVTAGYYNNAAATQSVFTANGWLRTGDLGFMRNGCLYISGRQKEIVFVNGQNFFAHDIEREAEQLDGIELNKIAVAGWTSATGMEQVAAFVFFRESLQKFMELAAALRAHISRRLGINLDVILPVKNIPRTTSGKLQRFKLLEEYRNGDLDETIRAISGLQEKLSGEQQHGEPADVTEAAWVNIFRQVCENDSIHAGHSFADAGGNSLLSTGITEDLRSVLGVELPLAALYENVSIRELAKRYPAAVAQEIPVLPDAPERTDYPLSSSQKRIYYAAMSGAGPVAYNVPVAMRLFGKPDTGQLQRAIQLLVQRHTSLRTSFPVAVSPVYCIHEQVQADIEIVTCTDATLQETLRQLVRPFVLDQCPLFRVALIETDSGGTVLFMDLHHSVADGISLSRLLKELWQLYAGEILPPPEKQPTDYYYWEEQHLYPQKQAVNRAYWSGVLAGELPVLQWPLDYPRPAMPDGKGAAAIFHIDAVLTASLKTLAAAHGITLHNALFAVYLVLLYKYTRQEDFIVGIPVSGRRHPAAREMAGAFVNNLPVRNQLNGSMTFRQLLEQVRQRLEEAYDCQDISFESLQELTGGKRPFDTMFTYQNMGLPQVTVAGIRMERMFFDPGFTKFDLSFEIFEHPDSLTCAFEYALTLFSAHTIQSMQHSFMQLVAEAAMHPDKIVADMDPLGNAMITGSLASSIHGPSGVIPPFTVHQLFRQQAARTPDHTAIIHGDQHISYRQLDRLSDLMAARLQAHSAGGKNIVPVLMDRSPGLLVAMLGVLKAGGCYLPMDTGMPAERISLLVTDSQAACMIVDDVSLVPAGITAITVPDENDPLSENAGIYRDAATPEDLAYVIYTSGTTGRPKGVMVTHHSLVNYVTWAASAYIKETSCNTALFTSPSFDLTVTAIFPPLLTGNTVVVYHAEDSAALMEQVMTDNRADVLKLTPAHLRFMAAGRFPLNGESRIKRLIVGGERLDTALAGAIWDAFGRKVEIYNEYGPTEATVGCMIWQFDPQGKGSSVPIGVPATNTQIYLLDSQLRYVPDGVHGDMYISGDCLAAGYLYRPEATAEKFIPHPFKPGKVLYHTGDVARRLPDGVLEYIGRSDQQIKINGYRVEPEEIAAALKKYPGITDALVVFRDNRLAAYYAGSNGLISENALLAAFLRERLPHYMIPACFMEITDIPLTTNGKVDYGRLPEPVMTPETYVAPRNETERLLATVFAEVLGITEMGIRDTFYGHGGDSIMATQIIGKLRSKGILLQARDIFQQQTIERISLCIRETAHPAAADGARLSGDRALLPAEAWFFEQQFANPGYYNQSVFLQLHQEPRIELLQACFDLLIKHHDGLRMNLRKNENRLYYNARHAEFPFDLHTFEIKPGERSLVHYCEHLRQFDLHNDLLFRAAIIRENGQAPRLFITAHHLVIDGVSWRILLEDLYTAYTSMEQGLQVQLQAAAGTAESWQAALSGMERAAPVTAAASLFGSGDRNVRYVMTVRGTLDKAYTAYLLRGAHDAYRTDVPVLLNTALLATCAEYAGKDRLTVQQEYHGRDFTSTDVSRAIGWFTIMQTIPVQLQEKDWGRRIMSVKEQLRQAGKQPDAPGTPMPAVRLNYLGQFATALNNPLFSFLLTDTGAESGPGNHLTAELELNCMVLSEELQIDFRYSKEMVSPENMQSFISLFLQHLRSLLDHLRQEKEVHLTPSDFMASLDQEEIDQLFT